MKSIADINAIRDRMQMEIRMRDNHETCTEKRIVVGMDTCGIKAGAKEVFEFLIEEIAKRGIDGVKVMRTGCMNNCELEPIVEVDVPGQDKVLYKNVDVSIAKRILEEHVLNGNTVSEYVIK